VQLKKTAVNQRIALAEAKVSHRAFGQVTAATTYSATVAPTQVQHPEYLAPQPRLQAVGGAPMQDLASVLARMDLRMAAIELHMTRTA
jgi:L-amino acid N-acyltransferase YncA